MEVVVKHKEYPDVIEEVTMIISKDQKKVLKIVDSKLQMDTIDDTISFTVSQELDENELRDFIQLCQRMLKQMLNTKN